MHNHLTPVAVVLLSIASLWTPAWGQTVYKCGNVYSQVPCPGAVAVEASDNRTPAQKAQADAAAAQAAKSADKMEKARLALEKAPVAKAPKLPVPASQIAKTKQKKKPPEYFTAGVPPEKKKAKNASSKTGAKPPALNSGEPAKI